MILEDNGLIHVPALATLRYAFHFQDDFLHHRSLRHYYPDFVSMTICNSPARQSVPWSVPPCDELIVRLTRNDSGSSRTGLDIRQHCHNGRGR